MVLSRLTISPSESGPWAPRSRSLRAALIKRKAETIEVIVLGRGGDIAVPPPAPGLIEPRVEALIKATGIDFRIGGNRAFYMPGADYVQVPPPQAYFEPINWHRTALHELGHYADIRIMPNSSARLRIGWESRYGMSA